MTVSRSLVSKLQRGQKAEDRRARSISSPLVRLQSTQKGGVVVGARGYRDWTTIKLMINDETKRKFLASAMSATSHRSSKATKLHRAAFSTVQMRLPYLMDVSTRC